MKYILQILILFLLLSCKNETIELNHMLGMDINSSIIQEFLKSQSEKPEILNLDEFAFYSYKENGISLDFNSNSELYGICLYSENADDFRKYSGELPNGLSFISKRKDIEVKLGIPDKTGGDGIIKYWSRWNNKGIIIYYKDKDTLNMENKIHHIYLFIPRKND